MKERIELIMQREHLSPAVFAEKIGIQRSTLAHILSGRNNPSLDVMLKIHQSFRYINLEWLLEGNGEINISKNGQEGSLFNFNDNENTTTEQAAEDGKSDKELSQIGHNVNKSHEVEVIKFLEKPAKKITEIRIFFDDNTFENFKPEK
jgi:transcriptional regulator with XRE-family HTH domain